jgi:Putative beta barrel porin-7 (BBP7)
MAARRIPVAAFVLVACAAACAQEPLTLPPARIAAPTGEVPPLLVVPPAQPPARRPCHACPNDYNPSHVYLPEQNPDWGAGSCDGECRDCRLWWINAAFLAGYGSDLGSIDRGLYYGVQVGAGHWFDGSKTLGLEVGFFNSHNTFNSFLNSTTLDNSPITLTTADVNLRGELFAYDRFRWDGLVGYRYVQLHEKLFVGDAQVQTNLDVRNSINAGQLGAVGDYRFGAFFAEALAKVAVGRNSETVSVNGVRFLDTTLSVIPELGLRVGYQLGEGLWGTLGYTLLYFNHVERPARGDTDYYLHGLTIGFESRF